MKEHPNNRVSLTLLNDEKWSILQPSIILDKHKIKRNCTWLSEVLIQWKELPEEEATWEGEHEVQWLYPHLDLEGKVNFNRGGIDTNNNIMGPKNKNIHVARDSSEVVTNSHTGGALEWANDPRG